MEILKAMVLWLICALLLYHGYWEVKCMNTEDSKSFECFLARGINVRTDNSIKVGFGLKK